MRRLLDTYIALWMVTDDPRLSAGIRPLICDPSVDVFVSMASLWEIAIKSRFSDRRRDARFPTVSQALEWFGETGLNILPITTEHIAAVEGLAPVHGDPFDRLLVAQAISEPMVLITHDRKLAPYSELVTVV